MTKPTTEKITGRTKSAAGELTGNDKLKREGKVDQAAASVREKGEDAIDRVKDALT